MCVFYVDVTIFSVMERKSKFRVGLLAGCEEIKLLRREAVGGPTAQRAMEGPAFNVLPLWPSQPLSFCRDVLDVQRDARLL